MGKWDRYAEEFNKSAMGRYAAWKADAGYTKPIILNDNVKATVGSITQLTTTPYPTFGTLGPLERYVPANDNYPRVIALSGVAGSGKSTASQFLTTKGYRVEKFAGPLKDMCRALGMTEREIEGDLKEKPTFHGNTPRHAMQTLGTAWGRECMGEEFWVNMWKARATGLVCADDCRFANEAAAVRSLGGVVIKLEGRGGIIGSHESERLDFIADAVVPNTGSVAQLHGLLDEVLGSFAD